MKKTFAVVLFLFALTPAMFGQFTHIGAAAGYGLAIKEPGFGLYGMYTINEQIKIVPSVLYYLPHEIVAKLPGISEEAFQTFTWWIANLDGHYVVVKEDAFQAYGLMGLSMVYLKGEQEHSQFPDKKYLYNMGLNVGAGIHIPIGERLTPFAEVKMTLSDKAYFTFREVSVTQLSIAAGVLIRISPDKDRSAEEE
jgi:hypothetical protein